MLMDGGSDVVLDRSGRGGISLPRPRPGGRGIAACRRSAAVDRWPARPGGRLAAAPATAPRLAWGKHAADGLFQSSSRAKGRSPSHIGNANRAQLFSDPALSAVAFVFSS